MKTVLRHSLCTACSVNTYSQCLHCFQVRNVSVANCLRAACTGITCAAAAKPAALYPEPMTWRIQEEVCACAWCNLRARICDALALEVLCQLPVPSSPG